MTEGTPLNQVEIRQLNRDLMEKVIDRAASDPEWKQRLLDDPEAAMREAGFPEARQLQEMLASVKAQEEKEVAGQVFDITTSEICDTRCIWTEPFPRGR